MLPDPRTQASGRRWVEEGRTLWLVGRGQSRLGYVMEYGDGWGASVRCSARKRGHCWKVGDRWYRVVMPGAAFSTREVAAAYLLRELAK